MKRVDRSWGHYIELFRCKWLCIKILNFTTGKQLSIQMHKHRYELWFWLIKPMEWHTFKPADNCRIMEIQFGKDVREDDIERL